MGTRSLIGKIEPDNSVKAIYCHWDGYPTHNGQILDLYYNTPDKVEELISLGGMSFLCKELYPDPSSPHSFDDPQKDVCVFYHRDRGEELDIRHYDSVKDFVGNPDEWDIEYFYVYNGTGWECYEPDGTKIPTEEWYKVS